MLCLFHSDNFVGTAALTEVCALLRAILGTYVSYVVADRRCMHAIFGEIKLLLQAFIYS